jgi:YVTN family beta-propeller protein
MRPHVGNCRSLFIIAAFSVATTLFAETPARTATDLDSPSNWRSPVALWMAPEGERLFVAGAKSGTLVTLDVANRSIVSESSLGKSLVSIAGTPDGHTLALCDAVANELVIVNRLGESIELRARVAVPTSPTHVTADADGKTCFVSSRWSRVISRVDLRTAEITATIPLDFSPHRSILLADGETLIVADAFGGELAVIDTQSNRPVRTLTIPGHNIRGMALAPDARHLLITHSILTESAASTRDNVFWGIVMTSNMRVIPFAALLDTNRNPVREAHTHFFGDPGNAAGDPEAVAVLPNGTTIVTFAGVGDVAVGQYTPYAFRRVGVGRRPTAVAISPDQKLAYVANAHSDTISVIDIEQRRETHTIPIGPEPQLRLAEEGEQLFYDARLTLDGWFSCHSCHTDGHSNGHRADTFGDGSFGAPKSVLSLMGTGATEPWAWNGSKRMLEEQIRDSMRTTMQPKSPPSERNVAALTAFLRSLPPPPVAAWQKADAERIARGEKVFSGRACTTCHVPPTYTNSHTYDVGLDDREGGNRQFNPPSLRGVAHNGPYFHDGRAKTIQEVLQKYQHRLRTALSDDEAQDLAAFLKSL